MARNGDRQKERVSLRWVFGSGGVGTLFVAAAFFVQYVLSWNGAPVEALISIGAAFGLAGVLYFLQRRFIVEVRQVATRTAESVADARVTERVQEVNSRLDELGKRMNEIVSERAQRQDAVVEAIDVPTYESVANALAEANKLAAIVDGQVRVQASRDRDELGLDFSWIRHFGDDRQRQPPRDVLKMRAHVYADERAQGGIPVIETDWKAGDSAADVGLRLREQLEHEGRWKSDGTLDWPQALNNLKKALGLAIRSRRRDGTGWLQGALIELVVLEWAITDAGVESPGHGVVVRESDFPNMYAEGRDNVELMQNWPPPAPVWVFKDLWDEVLRRGHAFFSRPSGPIRMSPTWIPLKEGPKSDS